MNIMHPFPIHVPQPPEELPPAALPFDASLLVQLVRQQYPQHTNAPEIQGRSCL